MSFVAQLRASWPVLRAASPTLVVGVVLYLAGALAIGARLSAAARGTISPLRAAMIALSSVFTSHVTFGAAAGETTKIAWLSRGAGLKDAVRIMLVDRLADAIAIGGLVILATHATTAALVIAALAAVLARRFQAFLRDTLTALPAALLAWALDLLRVVVVARAVGLALDLRAVASLALAALLGGQAPTPGGLGAVEAAMVAAGVALGLPIDHLVAAVVADRAITLVLGTTLGAATSAALATERRIA